MKDEAPNEYVDGTFRPLTDSEANRKGEVLFEDPNANLSIWELTGLAQDTFGIKSENLFQPDFKPLPGFDLEGVQEEMTSLPKDVQDSIKEASPESPEEYEYIKKQAIEYHDSVETLQRYGAEGAFASILGSLTDPESLGLTVVGGFIGGSGYAAGAARLAKTGKTIGQMRRAHRIRTALSEAVVGEAALGATKLHTNQEYDTDQLTTDMMLAPLMTYGTIRGLDKLGSWGKAMDVNNTKFVDAMTDIIEENMDKEVRTNLRAQGIETAKPLKSADVMAKARKVLHEKSLQKIPKGQRKDLEGKLRQVEHDLKKAHADYDNWKAGLSEPKGKQDKRIRREAEKQRRVEVERLEDYRSGLRKTLQDDKGAREAEANVSRLDQFSKRELKELPENLRKYLVRTRHQMLQSGKYRKGEPAKLPQDTNPKVHPLDDMESDLPDMGIDPQEVGYEASGMALRVDNYASAQRSKSPTLRKLAHAVYTDAVGSKGDNVGQGITADLTFDAKYSGILGGFNDAVTPAWRALMKKNGANWYNPFSYKKVNAVYEETSDRIRRAIHQGTVDQLPPEMQVIAREYTKLTKASLDYARAAGNRTAGRIKHSEEYVQFRYDKDKIRSMWANKTHRDGMHKLFEEAYYRGLQKAGKEVTREEAKFLAERTLNRIRDINGLNRQIDIDEFLQDPINLLKEIDAEQLKGGYLKFDNVKVQKLREKIKGQGESAEFKRRADLDRNVSVTLDDGTSLDFFKITHNNINTLADSYARSNIGKGVMARHLGVYDNDDLARIRRTVKEDLEKQGLGENEVNMEMTTFDEMIERAQGRPGVELQRMKDHHKAYMKSYMNFTYSAMLGGAGLAQVMDIMSSVMRNGLMNTFRMMPGIRNLTGNKQVREALLEAALSRDIAFHSPNMMQKYSQFDVDGSYATDGLQHATKVIAEGVGNLSGLSPLTRIMQEHSYTTSTLKTIRAFKAGKESPFLKSETGWSNAQEARFRNLVKKYSKKVQSKDFDEIEVPDFDKWPAKDAEDFMLGHYRLSNRQASRSMAGENIRMLETPLGRIMSQFKQIVFTSWARKFLHGANNMRTMKGMQANTLQMTGELIGAYVMIWAKIEHKTAGMDRAEKDKYVKSYGFQSFRHFERMHSATSIDDFTSQLGKVGMEYFMYAANYSPTIGGPLGLADLASNLAGVQLPGRRYQPLEASVFSNPSLSMGETIVKGAVGLADGQISDRDFKNLAKLIPANNWYGMGFIQNSIAKELPKEK